MTRRQSASVVEAQTLFEFALAPLAYSNEWIVLDDAEGFAPDFEPIGGAAFFRIEYGYTTRMLDGHQRKRKPDHNAGHSRNDNTATAACEGHHCDSDRQSCQRSARRGKDKRHGKKRDRGAQKPGGSG